MDESVCIVSYLSEVIHFSRRLKDSIKLISSALRSSYTVLLQRMTQVLEEKRFFCGVVEGFYGRPWTTGQRLDLFSRMARWNLNTYLYAPKDDEKHRACWRDAYLLDETDQLSHLIRQSSDRGVEFVYAIAPGLDITFSSEREVVALKQKLNQLVSLGCRSFAILFDDIDRDLCEADTLKFPSLAHCQVALTNLIYEYLGRPRVFMFCPTEYCGSRAQPSVKESPYLKHIGESLHPDIDVMWTGPKVISKTISLSSITELTSVIRRPPLIWDNLHANDYDTRRLFLGPYSGRPAPIIPYIRGVLTNPNCEYSLNYVAIHTLAQWIKQRPTFHHSFVDTISMQDTERIGGEVSKGAEPSSEMELNEGARVARVPVTEEVVAPLISFDPLEALQKALKEWLVEFHVPTRESLYQQQPTKTDNVVSVDQKTDNALKNESIHTDKSTFPFSLEDLNLLVDFFYLPFQHGHRAHSILEDFAWLKDNAPAHTLEFYYEKSMTAEGSEEVTKWLECAKQFHCRCTAVNDMYVRLTAIPNRLILYDLYHYVWDAKETTLLLNSYVSWLEAGGSEVCPEREPCIHHGGIIADMQMLLPQMNSCEELFNNHTVPRSPTSQMYIIRPYTAEDKVAVYQMCLKTGDYGEDVACLYPNFPQLLGDRLVGPYCALSSELAFVLEDSQGVCGYVLGVLDSERFYEQLKREWLPLLHSKYQPESCKTMSTTEQDALKQVMNPEPLLLPSLQKDYPSHIRIDLAKSAQGQGVGTRMINTILSALKARGSCGVQLELNSRSKKALQFYIKLGFTLIDFSTHAGIKELPSSVVLLVRRL